MPSFVKNMTMADKSSASAYNKKKRQKESFKSQVQAFKHQNPCIYLNTLNKDAPTVQKVILIVAVKVYTK